MVLTALSGPSESGYPDPAFHAQQRLEFPVLAAKTEAKVMESHAQFDVSHSRNHDLGKCNDLSEFAQQASERKLKMSVRTVLVTMFLSSMGFTICIPSLWLYFSHFEECRCHVSQSIATPHEAIAMVLPAATHGVEPHRFGVRSSIFRATASNQSTSACMQKNVSDDPRAICKERSQCNKFSGRPIHHLVSLTAINAAVSPGTRDDCRRFSSGTAPLFADDWVTPVTLKVTPRT